MVDKVNIERQMPEPRVKGCASSALGADYILFTERQLFIGMPQYQTGSRCGTAATQSPINRLESISKRQDRQKEPR